MESKTIEGRWMLEDGIDDWCDVKGYTWDKPSSTIDMDGEGSLLLDSEPVYDDEYQHWAWYCQDDRCRYVLSFDTDGNISLDYVGALR